MMLSAPANRGTAMGVIKGRVVCNLRSARTAKGISQSELAARVGVKRQAIYDMETGRYVPNTALALRIAKELSCKVENLFALDESEDESPVTLVERAGMESTRVSVARVRERLIAYPLDGKWLLSEGFQAADGLLSPDCSHVQLLRSGGQLEKKVLLLGCDPAFAILGAHASRYAADASVHCRFASSHLALERLAAGYAHIAGTHLHNPPSVESNVTLAQRVLAGSKAMVIAFSFFEEGLMVAPGNPHGIRTVADLAEEGIRFVNREPGAALRILLDERLAQAGITRRHISGDTIIRFQAITCALRWLLSIWLMRLWGFEPLPPPTGLDFVLMEAVRCDLVIPCDLLDLPAVKVLLDVLQYTLLARGTLIPSRLRISLHRQCHRSGVDR